MPLALPLPHSPGGCSPAIVFSQATKAAEEVFSPREGRSHPSHTTGHQALALEHVSVSRQGNNRNNPALNAAERKSPPKQ